MAETEIQWTATQGPDGTWHKGYSHNSWIGCSEVPNREDPGGPSECDSCYARRGSARLAAAHRLQLWPAHPGGPSDRLITSRAYMRKPLGWARLARKLGVRLKVFGGSYNDFGEQRADLVARREEYGQLILQTPELDWLLLTKRPETLAAVLPRCWGGRFPPNVWLGVTVGVIGSRYRLDALRALPRPAVTWVSMEPLLEDVASVVSLGGVDWVILGGESGPRARPVHLDWLRRGIDACRAAGAAPYVKQLGHRVIGEPLVRQLNDAGPAYYVGRWILAGGTEWVPALIGERSWQRPANAIGWVPVDSHGGNPSEWPEDLRVREYPRVAA